MQRKYEFQDGGSQTVNTCILASIQHASCKIPTATLIFSRWIYSMKLFIFHTMLREQELREHAGEIQNSDSQTGKTECQLVYNVAAQFQRPQTCIFELKNFAKQFPIFCNASERTYISAGIQYSCAIPTTVPMFSRSRNSKKPFFVMCDASWMQDASRHFGFLT